MRSAITNLLVFMHVISIACAKPPPPPASDEKLRRASWIEVTSPQFKIYSTMSEKDTKTLARDLERFRALIYSVTRINEAQSPIPTRIYAFAKRRHYLRFGDPETVGHFGAGMRANYIVLSNDSRVSAASRVVLHEYVHFVIRNRTSMTFPIWYDEGFAEFLSTARVFDDQLAIGLVPPERLYAVQHGDWFPLERIISGKSYAEFPGAALELFYAESWAIVHYLTLDRRDNEDLIRNLESYLLRVGMGFPAEVAFEKSFGESLAGMSLKIDALRKNRKWRILGISLSVLEYDRSEPLVRIPSEAEVAIWLGELSLAKGDGVAAESHFSASIAADPESSHGHAGLGDAFKFQGCWEEAEPHFRWAVEIDPDDAFNQLDFAEFLHDLALQPNRFSQRAALLEDARQVYRRSRELDPTIPETWAQLGRTYLAPGEDPAKAVALIEHAFEMLPSSPGILYQLVEAYVATNREEKARGILTKSTAVRIERPLDEGLDAQIARLRERRATEARPRNGDDPEPTLCRPRD